MAEVKIADVIEPSHFTKYVIEKTAERSELILSGIVERDPAFDALVDSTGSKTVDMPFWQDLDGEEEVLSDGAALTTAKITSATDKAIKHQRGKAWAVNDLAKHLAGDDPMEVISSLTADWWVRRKQAQLISTLKGIFASTALKASNSREINHTVGGVGTAASGNSFTGANFIDAISLMGDQSARLSAILMHSAAMFSLRKLDLIAFIPDSQGTTLLPTFQGHRVIVDDRLLPETIDGDPVYTSYIFGQGAIAWGEGNLNIPVEGGHGTEAVELSRNALAHSSALINRRKYILHPRGVRWTEAAMAGEWPTNAELENAANWAAVYEPKNVRIVQFRHNVIV